MPSPRQIRPANAGDAEAIRAIYAPFVIDTAVSFEVEPPTVEEMRQRIEQTGERLRWLVMEAYGELLGYAYASPHRVRAAYQWSVDVSAYVAEGHRGTGVGRALYEQLLEELRQLGYWNAYAGITLPNPASVALHERCGFVPVGVYKRVGYKLHSWHDVGWWQLALQPGDGEPGDIKGATTSG